MAGRLLCAARWKEETTAARPRHSSPPRTTRPPQKIIIQLEFAPTPTPPPTVVFIIILSKKIIQAYCWPVMSGALAHLCIRPMTASHISLIIATVSRLYVPNTPNPPGTPSLICMHIKRFFHPACVLPFYSFRLPWFFFHPSSTRRIRSGSVLPFCVNGSTISRQRNRSQIEAFRPPFAPWN